MARSDFTINQSPTYSQTKRVNIMDRNNNIDN